MKAKYILSSLLLAGCTFFSSCEDNLDISQHGVSTFENFYKTDADAEEAIIACYSNWKDTYEPAFWYNPKNEKSVLEKRKRKVRPERRKNESVQFPDTHTQKNSV